MKLKETEFSAMANNSPAAVISPSGGSFSMTDPAIAATISSFCQCTALPIRS